MPQGLAPGLASADTATPLTVSPPTLPPLIQTPPTVSLAPGDGIQVQLPPVSPDDGDGLGIGLPGFPPITTPMTLPARPTSEAPISVAMPGSPAPIGPAPTSRTGSGAPGGSPASPAATIPNAPHIEAARINSTNTRVAGVVDDHHRSGFWSTIGSAAVTYWFWFALCIIAMVVRFVAIAAWRDRMRASD